MTLYFKAPFGRLEHVMDVQKPTPITMCGMDASKGARFKDSERGPDSKVSPLCATCRSAVIVRRVTGQ